MSRIVVKNLPKKITEERIRELFCTKGLVTDVQLKYTPDGRFRQFCFVGYQTEDGAKSAIQHFNNTHINTSKVIVELCSSLGDRSKPKVWSKHATTSVISEEPEKIVQKPEDKKKKKAKESDKESITKNLLEKYKEDPMFAEFLEVHNKAEAEELRKIKSKQPEVAVESKEDEDDASQTNEEPKDLTDLEYLQQLKTKSKKTKEPKQFTLFTLKLRNLPYNTKKRDLKQFFKPITPFSIRIPRNVKGIAYAAFKQEKQLTQALLKDRSFMNGKQIGVMKYSRKGEDAAENEVTVVDAKRMRWKEQEDSLKTEEEIGESGKIFMRNLSYLTTEEDVEKLFGPFGPVVEVQLPIDTETRKSKGFGTVTFLMPEHAVRAYSQLDGAILHGRMLHLLPAKSHDPPVDSTQPSATTFKSQKQDALKVNAASSHNWNALFLGADAVAEVAAERHGATKADVVLKDGSGDMSAAVRLALAETQLVTETRKYLLEEGVDLTAFTQPGTKRSKTVILVKNLPAHTECRELNNIFEKFGVIGRIILPPGGISALVEFLEPSEARKAFTNLAYSKFKHLPLYLEWAPENSLIDRGEMNTNDTEKVKTKEDDIKLHENERQDEEENQEDEDEEEEEEGTTLFVKNLNFNTTDDSLKQHFSKCGKMKYANVATKRQGQGSQVTVLSMGYGFVRFYTREGADKALKTLQNTELEGKTLDIKRSERTLQQEQVTAGTAKTRQKRSKAKQTGTKILIRNIPFQATLNEAAQLFKVFGEMKAFRLPKKMGSGGSSGQHRGFGFVDYVTKSDAKRAFDALGESTHLYGRRLVLEWAAKDIDDADGDTRKEERVEDLRKRTAKHFARSQQEGPTKKKNSMFSID